MKNILLATETDSTGNPVQIYQTEKLGMSVVYPFFLRHYSELINNGHAYPFTTWDDERCGAVYAMDYDDVIGHIVYDTNNPSAPGSLWITLSAVEHNYRGRGIYKLLHKHFEILAKKMGYSTIASHVHVNNTVRLQSAESVGMKPVLHLIGKKV